MIKKFINIKGGYKFKGELKNGVPNGYGMVINDNGTRVYEGYWQNGKPHGFGTLFGKNGFKVYEGEWTNGLIHGQGKAFMFGDKEKLYEGEFSFGKPQVNLDILTKL